MEFSTYGNLLKFIFAKKRNAIKNSDSVQMMKKACKYFGNPQDKFDSIHVAGTNGKGSVTFKLSEIFRLSGYKAGLYTSPHLHTFRERIQINRQMISENEIFKYVIEILNSESKIDCNLSFFDISTLACFLYFANQKIDIGLIETGIGGLNDCTNILNPIISVITSIGEDHKSILGNTLDEISKVKAGIIKLNRPCVVGRDLPIEIFRAKCKEMNSEIFEANESPTNLFNSQHEKIIEQVLYATKKFHPKFNINYNIINNAFAQSLPCRKQIILPSEIYHRIKIHTKAQALVFDVGHNPPALEHLLISLDKDYHRKIRIIIGVSKDKDYEKIIETFRRFASHIYPVHGRHPRMLDPSILYECIKSSNNIGTSIINRGNIQDSIYRSLLDSNENEIILVCGSFFIMTEAFEALNIPIEKDPDYLN